MPRRWHTKTRHWIYRFLVLRDGDFCQECHALPRGIYSLDIDHKDGNPRNDDPPNLRLLCHRCNVAIENKSRARSKCPGERENPNTRVVKNAISYNQGSAEMQANYLFEIDYRTWILDFVSSYGWISKKEATNAGAEVVGCNPTTALKYLSKLTSLAGPLKEEKDMLNEPIIISKASDNGHIKAELYQFIKEGK